MKYDKTLTLFDVDKLVSLDKKVKEEINPEGRLFNVEFSACAETENPIYRTGNATQGFVFASMLTEFKVIFEEDDYRVHLHYKLKDGENSRYLYALSSYKINECFDLVTETKRLIKKEDV